MSLEAAIDIVKQIKNLHYHIGANRERWYSHTKYDIEAVFRVLDGKLPMKIEMDVFVSGKNNERIVFSFGFTKSGVTKIEENDEEKVLSKHWGSIAFVLLYNGWVDVIVILPYIEDVAENAEPTMHLAYLRPYDLGDSKIYEYVVSGLSAILEWEKLQPLTHYKVSL